MRENSQVADEAWVLTSDAGRELLAVVGASRVFGPAEIERLRKKATPAHVAAALRIVETRRRGASKFTRADQMWLEKIGLEQATAEVVARHKARRFATAGRAVFDLCSGIGGDAIALAEDCEVIAVDIDRGMARRVRWNAEVYGVSDRVYAIQGDAEQVKIENRVSVHVDPDRRAKSRERANRLEDYTPGLKCLIEIVNKVPGGAIKLGPASNFGEAFGGDTFEVELVSLNGECKEATVWFGDLKSCHRRATCLPWGRTWTDRDGPKDGYAAVGPVRNYVFDPDPSLLRVGLVDGFAVVQQLTRFADGIDFLTGDHQISNPFLSCFAVESILPLDLKKIKKEVKARGIGTLEIKTRGVDRLPEALRKELSLAGECAMTLILTGGKGHAHAIFANRVTTF